MALADRIDDVERRRKTLTVYAPEAESDVVSQFATKNVTVRHRRIRSDGPEGFVVVRDESGFVGSVSLSELATLTRPPISDAEMATDESRYRALLEVLSDTLFSSFDRRQLLATAREIENRAWRVGRGTLRVGFQSVEAYRAQRSTYAHLGGETNLDVHVYVRDDWDATRTPGVTAHSGATREIGRFWFLAFDGGGEEAGKCALVAEERAPGEFYGFWTYDPRLVDDVLTYLARAYR